MQGTSRPSRRHGFIRPSTRLPRPPWPTSPAHCARTRRAARVAQEFVSRGYPSHRGECRGTAGVRCFHRVPPESNFSICSLDSTAVARVASVCTCRCRGVAISQLSSKTRGSLPNGGLCPVRGIAESDSKQSFPLTVNRGSCLEPTLAPRHRRRRAPQRHRIVGPNRGRIARCRRSSTEVHTASTFTAMTCVSLPMCIFSGIEASLSSGCNRSPWRRRTALLVMN